MGTKFQITDDVFHFAIVLTEKHIWIILWLTFKYACIVHKTLLKSLQEHYQTVFSRFLVTTTFVPAENTRDSEFPGHIPLDHEADTLPLHHRAPIHV
jgi:hypothetical protein